MFQLKDEVITPDRCQMSSSLQFFFRLFGVFFKVFSCLFVVFRIFWADVTSSKLSAHVTVLCNSFLHGSLGYPVTRAG